MIQMLRVSVPATTTAGVTHVTRQVTSPRFADPIAGVGTEIGVTGAAAREAVPLRGAMAVVTVAEIAEMGETLAGETTIGIGVTVETAIEEIETGVTGTERIVIASIAPIEITLSAIALTHLTRTMKAVVVEDLSQCHVLEADLDLVPTQSSVGMTTEMIEETGLVVTVTVA